MAENYVSRKDGMWRVMCIAPDVCLTPVGSSVVPIPYQVTSQLSGSTSVTRRVFVNGKPAVVYDASKVPQTIGDMAGSQRGIVSGTVGADTWPLLRSFNVRAEDRYINRHDDLYYMNGRYNGNVGGKSKAERWQCRKQQIEQGKKQVGEMPPGPERDKLANATERFERNNTAVEKARLAQDVYDPKKGPPEGWNNISNDKEALAKYGLKPQDLEKSGSNFRAQVYEPDPKVFGNDMKPTVSFKGTDFNKGEDWSNNLAQGVNAESSYYNNAVKIGNKLKLSGADADITGHSLGGGLASSASRASGLPATTFNSAGLHPATVNRYGGTSVTPKTENVKAYQVAGEILTGVQEQGIGGTLLTAGIGGLIGVATGGSAIVGALIGAGAKVLLSALMPDAIGKKYPIPGQGANPVARHGMDQVIDGIEKQKQEDQAILAGATGVQCG
ncbi:PAAR-like domain-containing protein [Parachitinimonas caeni]|uniref:DUF4150 domain-containing protein n=1 Tax=Parachitinimonas caeni TaxID=3031301 RepID=A0ABT7E138_9NEIS|nr:PAAR-like domain-containing protein [Parachitinimonas caeni]MDK2126011.1 DUF4150 domain-containing protein [Parachitinimonas caeni]